jgi:hypothetical protein
MYLDIVGLIEHDPLPVYALQQTRVAVCAVRRQRPIRGDDNILRGEAIGTFFRKKTIRGNIYMQYRQSSDSDCAAAGRCFFPPGHTRLSWR